MLECLFSFGGGCNNSKKSDVEGGFKLETSGRIRKTRHNAKKLRGQYAIKTTSRKVILRVYPAADEQWCFYLEQIHLAQTKMPEGEKLRLKSSKKETGGVRSFAEKACGLFRSILGKKTRVVTEGGGIFYTLLLLFWGHTRVVTSLLGQFIYLETVVKHTKKIFTRKNNRS